MDMLSDIENTDKLLGNENAYPIEREIANTNNGSVSNNDLESDYHFRTNSLKKIKLRTLAMKGSLLDKIKFWSLCKRSQMRSA